MHRVSSWGRLSLEPHQIIPLHHRATINQQLITHQPGIPYGMGRSYGDVCLSPQQTLWQTQAMDHLLHFNEATGLLRCEAGVLLKTIQEIFVPQGWMLPVTPGTQFVTIGGAIANDVHGKNHHAQGSFGDHVHQITLQRTTGETILCSPTHQPEWFKATIGGLGLTGLITEAEIRLRQVPGPWLQTEIIPYHNLETFFQLADTSEASWEYTVSWIDCLARKPRGLFMRANSIDRPNGPLPKKNSFTFPLTPPISLVNKATLHLFNHLYFYVNTQKTKQQITHYQPFFYPLDQILAWNRMYGRKGFYQYQCVVPREAISLLLYEVSKAKAGSFLSVLKTFGHRPAPGLLSFPQPGVTLALDFPNQGSKTLKLFQRLDAIVEAAKGRIYFAKNAYMSASLFKTAYPAFTEFLKYRDPGMHSGLSKRLMET